MRLNKDLAAKSRVQVLEATATPSIKYESPENLGLSTTVATFAEEIHGEKWNLEKLLLKS
jgi:hypothetical protein